MRACVCACVCMCINVHMCNRCISVVGKCVSIYVLVNMYVLTKQNMYSLDE